MLSMPDALPLHSENSFLTQTVDLVKSNTSSRTHLRKRFFDIVFSLLVICFLLIWLVPLIALLIRLESKGPVFFRQLRTGKDGKPFYCLKFRSMRPNTQAHAMQARRNDARITVVGAYLRKTSLDELPQFFNVLRGEMSIVGPRPHMLAHTKEYALLIENFMDRHLIMPGITGLAQVSGYRGETRNVEAMAKRVEADINYLHSWTFWLDIKIIWLTVKQVIVTEDHVF
jgi:putative colanic acid biosynthesis UDP-glucose lipid carrier transferase